ncbi:MAG: hypothetical protein QOI40_5002, partial [Alphaproteobacteria bacterium]|nr:hypothetical protein [Alphaproteobacteria bacterium]
MRWLLLSFHHAPSCQQQTNAAGREPSLGSIESHAGSQSGWAGGDSRDLEGEHDGAEPDEDGEPSLGSFDRMADQEKSWSQSGDAGFRVDYEQHASDPGKLAEARQRYRSKDHSSSDVPAGGDGRLVYYGRGS